MVSGSRSCGLTKGLAGTAWGCQRLCVRADGRLFMMSTCRTMRPSRCWTKWRRQEQTPTLLRHHRLCTRPQKWLKPTPVPPCSRCVTSRIVGPLIHSYTHSPARGSVWRRQAPQYSVFDRASGVNRVTGTDEGWYCSRCSARNSSAAQSCASCGQGDGRATTAPRPPPPNKPAARARVAPSAWPQAHGQQQLSVGYFHAQPPHGEAADGQHSTSAYFNPAVPAAPMVRSLPFGVRRRYHTRCRATPNRSRFPCAPVEL